MALPNTSVSSANIAEEDSTVALQITKTPEWDTFTTILVGPPSSETKFRIHTHVLRRCDWFAKCLDAGMREAHEDIVRLPEDDPAVVEQLISWLYCWQFEHGLEQLERLGAQSEAVPKVFRLLIGVYLLAKKLCIEELQNQIIDVAYAVLRPFCWPAESLDVIVSLGEDDDLRKMVLRGLGIRLTRIESWETFKSKSTLYQDFAMTDISHMSFVLDAKFCGTDQDKVDWALYRCDWHTHIDTPRCLGRCRPIAKDDDSEKTGQDQKHNDA